MSGPGERLRVVAETGRAEGLGCIAVYLPGMTRPGRDALPVIERVGRGRHLALERASTREALAAPATLGAQIKALDEVLDDQAPDVPVILVAHSYAGLAATVWAARNPARCRAVILLDSSIPSARRPRTALRWRWALARLLARPLRLISQRDPWWRWAGAVEENASYAEVSRAAWEEVAHPLHAAAVVVTACPRVAGPRARSWVAQQEALAHRLAALHVVVRPSGHLIASDRPEDIAALIRAAQGGLSGHSATYT